MVETMASMEVEIRSIIADVAGVDVNEVKLEANIVEDLEVDSIKAIEIVVAIEKKFRVSIRDEDVPKIATVRDAVATVGRLLSQTQAGV